MISVIILNLDGKPHLEKCVEAVLNSTYKDLEILIRENGSTDGSKEWLEQIKDPRLKVYHRKNDGNFSSMNNEMAALSKGDILLFLNNDCYLDEQSIENMMKLTEDDSVGCVGARLRYPSGELQHAGIVCGPDNDPVNISYQAIKSLKINDVCLTDNWEYKAVTAACLLVQKKYFDAVDGFDPIYDWAYEDVDLCLKIHFHLNKINLVCQTGTGVHVESASGAKPNLRENFKKFQERWSDLFKPDCNQISHKKYIRKYPQKDISFIVCVNNFKQFNNILIKSIYSYRDRYELIPIYNFSGKLSAPQALNIGISCAKTEWLVLTHQDVEYSKNWIDKIFSELPKCQKLGMAGLAGIKIVEKKNDSIPIDDGNLHINVIGAVKTPENGKISTYGQMPSGEVDVLDELCIITKKSLGFRFDEKILNHFHFYGVDISLQSKNKGYKNYVIDAVAIHHSDGSSSISKGKDIYWREFKKVYEKWKNIFPNVVTTTGYWNKNTINTFYKEEKEDKQPSKVQQSHTAKNIQIPQHDSVELVADELGSWFINGVLICQNVKTFTFKPSFQGLHKVTHQGTKISDWWVQTVPASNIYTVGMCQNFHTHQLGEIFGGKTIIQEIVCDRDNLAKVDIFIGTYRRKNTCRLSLQIENMQGAILRSAFLDSSFMQDNDWNEFTFEPVIDSKNQKYKIKIFSPDGKQGNAVTVYYVNHTFYFGNLYQNNRKLGGCLSFRLSYL
jgi:GT2 family glycosyltransferase